jgi:hypothetical protein
VREVSVEFIEFDDITIGLEELLAEVLSLINDIRAEDLLSLGNSFMPVLPADPLEFLKFMG